SMSMQDLRAPSPASRLLQWFCVVSKKFAQRSNHIPTFKIDPATLFRLPGSTAHGLDKKKHPFFRVGHP
ncbi:hypothetical protein, partial [Pseudomonas sp. BF-RE-01]